MGGPSGAAGLGHHVHIPLDLVLGPPVHLNEEQSLRFHRQPQVHVLLHGGHRGLVHEFNGGGEHAAVERPLDGQAGVVQAGEGHQGRAYGGRPGDEAHGHLGDDAQRPFGADEQVHQVVAGDVLDELPAQGQRLPLGGHHLHGEDVVPGYAVLHAAGAASVGGNVPAQGALADARWVRGVEEAQGLHGALEVGGDHAGFGRGGHVGLVHLRDAVEAGEDEDNAPL